MSRLCDSYRAVHEQGFLPIFVEDEFDTRRLIDACVQAGCRCIEYTLRRHDAHKMIPWIRQNYPDLYLLIGSTIDDEKIVKKMRIKHPQLLTIEQLRDIGVDGFVSMIGWTLESINRYAKEHIIIPTAMTVTEALQQVGAGAHFVKLEGSDIDFVRRCRAAAAFDYCPIMVTRGMTPQRIPEAVAAGAVIIATGFDIILKDESLDNSVGEITLKLQEYLDVTQKVRAKNWPQLKQTKSIDREKWLDSLPHYHPF